MRSKLDEKKNLYLELNAFYFSLSLSLLRAHRLTPNLKYIGGWQCVYCSNLRLPFLPFQSRFCQIKAAKVKER